MVVMEYVQVRWGELRMRLPGFTGDLQATRRMIGEPDELARTFPALWVDHLKIVRENNIPRCARHNDQTFTV